MTHVALHWNNVKGGGGESESCGSKESAIDAPITPAEIHQGPWQGAASILKLNIYNKKTTSEM